jgi:hypothetical protein
MRRFTFYYCFDEEMVYFGFMGAVYAQDAQHGEDYVQGVGEAVSVSEWDGKRVGRREGRST